MVDAPWIGYCLYHGPRNSDSIIGIEEERERRRNTRTEQLMSRILARPANRAPTHPLPTSVCLPCQARRGGSRLGHIFRGDVDAEVVLDGNKRCEEEAEAAWGWSWSQQEQQGGRLSTKWCIHRHTGDSTPDSFMLAPTRMAMDEAPILGQADPCCSCCSSGAQSRVGGQVPACARETCRLVHALAGQVLCTTCTMSTARTRTTSAVALATGWAHSFVLCTWSCAPISCTCSSGCTWTCTYLSPSVLCCVSLFVLQAGTGCYRPPI